MIEVRAVRTINRVYNFARVFAITHLYHAYRAQVYFNEVLPNALVMPAHPEILNEIAFPPKVKTFSNKFAQLFKPHYQLG